MPRKKKKRCMPIRLKFSPRVDTTSERVAYVVLNAGRPNGKGKESYCVDCGLEVCYPETLYNYGRCEECHAAHV